ncbi:hypothetical protein [Parapedobacter sp. 10938]|uniref:hypothetical protein n=1 Tax=Parapedobacter flavus TaxID=3110225 RepID=UPI002DBB9151|nr:hypothetical protein [Parapedobacter sp. 10938]MEC3878251.1 hypothetical protein [Parapedobacter sp. 10938]
MIRDNTVKYLSFSLWGDQPHYTVGAIRNAELAREIYVDWHVLVYHDNTVPDETLTQLQQLNVQLIDMTGSPIYSLFWRFLAADIEDCSHAIFRDTDSRISLREQKAVDEWIKSGNTLHVMRDHPHHQTPFGAQGLGILGGMWGIRGGSYAMESAIRGFITEQRDQYGVDQNFLQEVYRTFGRSQTIHDDFFERKPFPVPRTGYHFIGERIDEHEQPIGEDREALKYYLSPRKTLWFKRLRKKILGR